MRFRRTVKEVFKCCRGFGIFMLGYAIALMVEGIDDVLAVGTCVLSILLISLTSMGIHYVHAVTKGLNQESNPLKVVSGIRECCVMVCGMSLALTTKCTVDGTTLGLGMLAFAGIIGTSLMVKSMADAEHTRYITEKERGSFYE